MNIRCDARFASALVVAILTIPSVLGCNSDMPFDLVPVHGKVSYEDGSLITADSILVTFNPVNAEKGKLVPPGGQTTVNVADGTFSAVSSRRKDDGIVRGRHKVVVVSFETGRGGTQVPSQAVPPLYRKVASTPLEVEVESVNQFLDLRLSKK